MDVFHVVRLVATPASDSAQCSHGSLDRVGQVTGAQPGAGLDERLWSEPGQLLAEGRGRGDHDQPERVDRCGVGLDRTVASDPQCPDRLHDAVTTLRRPRRGPGLNSPCRGDGVDRTGLALLASSPSVWLVDLDDLDPVSGQVSSQAGAVGAGAFDPTATTVPWPANQVSNSS